MKRFFAVLALGLFLGSSIIGCEASAKVGDTDSSDGGSYKKTTTVQQPSGDKSTKTEYKQY